MPASKTLLLLGLAAFIVVSAAATENGSGLDDDEFDAFVYNVTEQPPPNVGFGYGTGADFDDDYDAVGNYADQDAQDQLDSLIDEPSNSLSSSSSSSNDEVDSGQTATIVILSLLIVVALVVAAFYSKRTRDLQADHLQGLVANGANPYDRPDDLYGTDGTAYQNSASSSFSSKAGAWNIEVNPGPNPSGQSQAYGAPTDIMADMHGSGGHEGATLPGTTCGTITTTTDV